MAFEAKCRREMRIMKTQHWQDWVNALLGLWVVLSPSMLAHVMASSLEPGGVPEAVMWNQYVVGGAIAALAVVALFAFKAWEEWTNVILGAWLLASPWMLGFYGAPALMWNAVILGVLVLGFAGWILHEDQEQTQPTVR